MYNLIDKGFRCQNRTFGFSIRMLLFVQQSSPANISRYAVKCDLSDAPRRGVPVRMADIEEMPEFVHIPAGQSYSTPLPCVVETSVLPTDGRCTVLNRATVLSKGESNFVNYNTRCQLITEKQYYCFVN